MRDDAYPELDFTDIAARPEIDRRDFLKIAGGGIIIVFTAGEIEAAPAERRGGGGGRGQGLPADFNAFLRVFLRVANPALTTWKKSLSLQSSFSVWFRVSLITPELTFGGGSKTSGGTEKRYSIS